MDPEVLSAIKARLKIAMEAKRTLSQFQDELRKEGIALTYFELRTLAAECEATPPDPEFAPNPKLEPPPLVRVTPHTTPAPGCIFSGVFRGASGSNGEWRVGNDGKVAIGGGIGMIKPTPEEGKMMVQIINQLWSQQGR